MRSSAQPISSPAVRSAATSASSRALSRRTCVFSHAAMVKSRRADSRRLAASFDFSDLTILVIGDHKIGESKTGAASVIGFESGNRFLNLS